LLLCGACSSCLISLIMSVSFKVWGPIKSCIDLQFGRVVCFKGLNVFRPTILYPEHTTFVLSIRFISPSI
jgi:hypothetical protein